MKSIGKVVMRRKCFSRITGFNGIHTISVSIGLIKGGDGVFGQQLFEFVNILPVRFREGQLCFS